MNPFSVSSKIERSSAPTRREKKKKKCTEMEKKKREMGIDHVERFQIGAAGSMNNTSKFRRIDAFGQWCLQWGRSEELRLTGFQFSIMSSTAGV